MKRRDFLEATTATAGHPVTAHDVEPKAQLPNMYCDGRRST
jgi:hypothetical protein